MDFKNKNITACFLGLAIGDSLGVPVEFNSRAELKKDPVKTMRGYGCWNQPPGTWSDDSSLTFCLAESLTKGYDLNDIGKTSVRWMRQGHWGAHHAVFDIGGTTRVALSRVAGGEDPLYSGEFDEDSNGNGSLMRIIPASLYFAGENDETLLERMREISGFTHRHFRSVLSCFIYSKLVSKLLKGLDKHKAYTEACAELNAFFRTKDFNASEMDLFSRTLDGTLVHANEETIKSSGYVLHTLEASIWTFLNTSTFSEAVLTAVNLGGDTDTTGCVTGALAGLYYGAQEIPLEWINTLARKEDIIELSKNFQNKIDTLIFR